MQLSKDNLAFIFKEQSATILPPDAITSHINYLQNGPYIGFAGEIIHSLAISGPDLASLCNNGPGGIRLYFGLDNGIVTNLMGESFPYPYLSIIAVPVGNNGDNVLTNAAGSTLINNLEPCPDKCPCNETYNDSYSVNDLNYQLYTKADGTQIGIWCKPNKATKEDPRMWFDNNGNPIK